MNATAKTIFSFWKSQTGSTAMIAGIAMPALIGFGALAVDVGHFYSLKTNMQQAADLGALSVLTQMRDTGQVNDLPVGDAAPTYLELAKAMANKNMPERAKNLAVKDSDIHFGKWDFKRKVFITDATATPTNAVRISGQMSEQRTNPIKTMFGKIFKDHIDLSVSTMAVLPVPDSFLILSPDADGALTMSNGSDIDTQTIHINSASQDAFSAPEHSHKAGVRSVNVVGGISGPTSSKYTTGADASADFLIELPALNYQHEPCEENNLVLDGGGSHVLLSGRYCGGLTIGDVDDVTFEDGGTFIIEGGPFLISHAMRGKPVKGNSVLIYLADERAEVRIAGADLSLSAQQTGPYAGVVFMTAPGLSPAPDIILSNVDLYLSGIFYAPNSAVTSKNSTIDGVCGYICFVSSTLALDATKVNVGPDMEGHIDPFGNVATIPASPPALLATFRPHLINTAAPTH